MADFHGRFLWYELMTTDVEAAKAFYADVVGWGTQDVSAPSMAYTLFTAGEAPAAGVMALPEEARQTGATPRWLGYVGVDDVDTATDRVERLGGTVHLPPRDVPGMIRFSIVADPQMATLALFKPLAPGQGQLAAPATLGRVSWHELLAANREKALAFYSELFRWQKAETDVGPFGTYQLFSAGGQTIGGMFTKAATVPVPFWLYYFGVGDIDVAAKRVKAVGGQILEGPIEVPGGGWCARCMDPQGAMFALAGPRARKAIGYFESAASRNSSGARGRRWSW